MSWFKDKVNKFFAFIVLICAFISILSPIIPSLASNVPSSSEVISQAQALDNRQALGGVLKGCTDQAVGQSMIITCTRDVVNIIAVIVIMMIIVRIAAAQLGIVIGAGESAKDGAVVLTRKAILDGILGVFLIGGVTIILNLFNDQIVSNVAFKGNVRPEIIKLCRDAVQESDMAKKRDLVTDLKNKVKEIRDGTDKDGGTEELVYIAGGQCAGFLVKTGDIKPDERTALAYYNVKPVDKAVVKAIEKDKARVEKASIKVVPADPDFGDIRGPDEIDYSNNCKDKPQPVCPDNMEAVCGSDVNWYCTNRAPPNSGACRGTACEGGNTDKKCVKDKNDSEYQCKCFHPISCPAGYKALDNNNGGCDETCVKITDTESDITSLANKCRGEQGDNLNGNIHCTIGEIAGLVGGVTTPGEAAELIPVLQDLNVKSVVSPSSRELLGQIAYDILTQSISNNVTMQPVRSSDLIYTISSIVNNRDKKLQSDFMKPVHEMVVRKVNQGVVKIYSQDKREYFVTNALNQFTTETAAQDKIHWINREDLLLNVASAVFNNSFNYNEKIKGESYQAFAEIANKMRVSANFMSDLPDDGVAQMAGVLTDINADILSKITPVESYDEEDKFFALKVTEAATENAASISFSKMNLSESTDNFVSKLSDYVSATYNLQNNTTPEIVRNSLVALSDVVEVIGDEKYSSDSKNAGKYEYTGYKKMKNLVNILSEKKPEDDLISRGAFQFAGSAILKMQDRYDQDTIPVAKAIFSYLNDNIINNQAATGYGAVEGLKIISKIYNQKSDREAANIEGVDRIKLQESLKDDAFTAITKVAELAKKPEDNKTNFQMAVASIDAALAGARFFNDGKDPEGVSTFNKASANILSAAFKIRTECDEALNTGKNIARCTSALADSKFIQDAVSKGSELIKMDYVSLSDLDTIASVITNYLDDVQNNKLESLSASKDLILYAQNLIKKASLGDINEGSHALKNMTAKSLDVAVSLMRQLKNCEDRLNKDPNKKLEGPCLKTNELSQEIIAIAGDLARKVKGVDQNSVNNFVKFFIDISPENAIGYSFSYEGLNALGAIVENNPGANSELIKSYASTLLNKAVQIPDLPYTEQFLGILKLAQGVGGNGNINIGDLGSSLGSIMEKYKFTLLAPEFGSELVNTTAALTYGGSKSGGDLAKLLQNNWRAVGLAQRDATGSVDAYRMVQGMAGIGQAIANNPQIGVGSLAIEDFSFLLSYSGSDIRDRLLGGNKVLMNDLVTSLNKIDWKSVKSLANGNNDTSTLRAVGGSSADALSTLLVQIKMPEVAKMVDAGAKIITSKDGADSSASAILAALGALPMDSASGKTAIKVVNAISTVDWDRVKVNDFVKVVCSTGVDKCETNNVLFKALGNIDMFSVKYNASRQEYSIDTSLLINSVKNIISSLNNMDITTTTKVGAQYAFSFMADLDLSQYLSPEMNTFVKKVINSFNNEKIFSGDFSAYFLDNYSIFVDFALDSTPLLKDELQKIVETFKQASNWLKDKLGEALDLLGKLDEMIKTVLDMINLLNVNQEQKDELKRVLGVVRQVCNEMQNILLTFRPIIYESNSMIKNFTFK